MWSAGVKPRLASKVRLRWDEVRGKAMLLYPEGILVLNPTAQAILELCDGERTIEDIVRELARRFDGSPGAQGAAQIGRADAAATDVALNTDTITGGTSDADQASIVSAPGAEAAAPDAGAPESAAARGARSASPPVSSNTATASTPETGGASTGLVEREQTVERDVKAFLERVLQRGWVQLGGAQ